MEILGAVRCLQALRNPGTIIEIRSDSQYLIKAATEWMPGWKRNGWKRKARRPGKCRTSSKSSINYCPIHTVTWQWVKGHAGDAGNEFVDEMLNKAMDRMQAGQPATDESRSELAAPLKHFPNVNIRFPQWRRHLLAKQKQAAGDLSFNGAAQTAFRAATKTSIAYAAGTAMTAAARNVVTICFRKGILDLRS